MKILLANLPWIDDREFIGIRAGSRWPHLRFKKESLDYFPFPFSLAYSAAVLKQNEFEILLKDCIASGTTKDEFLKEINTFYPAVAVFETSSPSIDNDLAYTLEVKKRCNCATVLVGPHVTALPDEILKNSFVDFVLLGEYEYALRDLVIALQNNADPLKLKGICGRRGGDVVINERAALIEDLDDLLFPLREALPVKKYIDPFCKHVPNVQMLTSRGCPYNCIFCLEPSVYYGRPSYRVRNPKSVVDEMQYLIDNYNAQEIYFDDACFSIDQERVMAICKEIRNRNIKIFWSCMADAKMKVETLKEMKEAGCIAVKFGVESADPIILKNINKHINLEDVKNIVALCNEIGIETHATYMFGLPGETKDTIQNTIDFAFGLNTNTAQFSVAIPYPGTKFFEMAKQNGWLMHEHWHEFDGQRQSVIEYPDLKKEDILNAMHYCRRRILIKVLLNPRQLLQYVIIIYRYAGFFGTIKILFEKLLYLFSR